MRGQNTGIFQSILLFLGSLTLFPFCCGASYSTQGITASVDKSITAAYAQPISGAALEEGTNPRGYVVNLSYVFHLKGQRASKPGTGKIPPGLVAQGDNVSPAMNAVR